MSALRRETFIYPHPSPVARLSMAANALEALDAIAHEDVVR
ncbi:hypothetical protein [Leifsonia sp. TF02-11]|nr:hypothetical protein [Leifsonia sp. TF02-11]